MTDTDKEKMEIELRAVWDECKKQHDELDEKYKHEPGIDGHGKEHRKITLEAVQKADEIKKKYGYIL